MLWRIDTDLDSVSFDASDRQHNVTDNDLFALMA